MQKTEGFGKFTWVLPKTGPKRKAWLNKSTIIFLFVIQKRQPHQLLRVLPANSRHQPHWPPQLHFKATSLQWLPQLEPPGCWLPLHPQLPLPHPQLLVSMEVVKQHQVWAQTQFFTVSYLWKIIDLPGGQINDLSSGRMLLSSVPSINSLLLIPLKGSLRLHGAVH